MQKYSSQTQLLFKSLSYYVTYNLSEAPFLQGGDRFNLAVTVLKLKMYEKQNGKREAREILKWFISWAIMGQINKTFITFIAPMVLLTGSLLVVEINIFS